MHLTPQQLKIQQFSDKTLSFGCLVLPKYPNKRVKQARILAHFGGGNYRVMERIDTSENQEELEQDYGHCEFCDYEKGSFEIIGHPITLSRFAYLRFSNAVKEERDNYDHYSSMLDKWDGILEYCCHNPDICNQTILEWSPEFMSLVEAFLDTLPNE